MSLRTTWVGVAVSATAKISVGYTLGNTQQYIHLYNCENPRWLHQPCTIVGKLNGLAAHAALGTSVAVITGVSHKALLEGLVSTGYDFAFDVGGRAGETVKTAARAPSLVDALKEAYNKKNMIEWLLSEAGKSAVNGVTGDLSLANGKPSFALWGTPVGAGLGVGVWYETQTLHLAGTRLAWDQAQIRWRLVKSGDSLWLQMQGIPEADGVELTVVGKEFHTLYPDGRVRLGQPGSRNLGTANATAVVRDGMIHEKSNVAGMVGKPPPGGGINLSSRSVDYVTDFPYTTAVPIDKKDYLDLGFRLVKDKRTVWESGDSTRVHFSLMAAQNWSNANRGSTRLDKQETHYWTQ